MHETSDDLTRLQTLLDESHASMGAHMRFVLAPEKRLTAARLVDELEGMKLLTLATVNGKGEPRVGPVDAFFYHGAFWFGSAPESVRFRHIRARPAVSATHLDGERFAVTVHGEAHLIDTGDPAMAGFRDLLIDNYGETWLEWSVSTQAQYARIDAKRMYTYFTGEG